MTQLYIPTLHLAGNSKPELLEVVTYTGGTSLVLVHQLEKLNRLKLPEMMIRIQTSSTFWPFIVGYAD